MKFSNDGNLLATGSVDNEIHIFQTLNSNIKLLKYIEKKIKTLIKYENIKYLITLRNKIVKLYGFKI